MRHGLAELHRPALELAEHPEQLLGGACLDLGGDHLGRAAADPLAEPERRPSGEAQRQRRELGRAGHARLRGRSVTPSLSLARTIHADRGNFRAGTYAKNTLQRYVGKHDRSVASPSPTPRALRAARAPDPAPSCSGCCARRAADSHPCGRADRRELGHLLVPPAPAPPGTGSSSRPQGGRGREKPWQATSLYTSWSWAGATPEAAEAGSAPEPRHRRSGTSSRCSGGWTRCPQAPRPGRRASEFGDTHAVPDGGRAVQRCSAQLRSLAEPVPDRLTDPSAASARIARGHLPAARLPACRTPPPHAPPLDDQAPAPVTDGDTVDAVAVPPLLHERDFRRFWTGQIGRRCSATRSRLLAVPAAWPCSCCMRTPSRWACSTAVGMLPSLLLSDPGRSAVIDRHGHRRQVMLASDVARAVLLVVGCRSRCALHVLRARPSLRLSRSRSAPSTSSSSSRTARCSSPWCAPTTTCRGISLLNGSRAFSYVAGQGLAGVLVAAVTAPDRTAGRLGLVPRLGRLPRPHPPGRAPDQHGRPRRARIRCALHPRVARGARLARRDRDRQLLHVRLHGRSSCCSRPRELHVATPARAWAWPSAWAPWAGLVGSAVTGRRPPDRSGSRVPGRAGRCSRLRSCSCRWPTGPRTGWSSACSRSPSSARGSV